jgi:predicted DNA-binding transcriptional regulator AlpA
MSPSPFPRSGVSAVTLAHTLGIDVASLYRWHAHGRGPLAVAEKTSLRFTRNAIEAWLDTLGNNSPEFSRSVVHL